MGYFSPAEHDSYLCLVVLPKETFDVPQLKLIIMFFGLRADFHFLYLNYGLFLFRLLEFLALHVFVLTIVHYLAYRWRCFGRHFHQVQFFFSCTLQCFFQRHYPQLCAVYTYETDLGSSNPVIYVNVLVYFSSLLSEMKLSFWSLPEINVAS